MLWLHFLACRDRLSASDMLQVRKVIEHVYEKVMGQGSDAGSQTAAGANSTANSQAEKSEGTEKEEDLSSIAEEKVELLCNDQVCHMPIISLMLTSMCLVARLQLLHELERTIRFTILNTCFIFKVLLVTSCIISLP